MKIKLSLSFLLYIMSCICLYAQAQVQMIDQAIIASALRISRELPANVEAAIIDFSSASSELNNHVVKELHGAILWHRRIVPVSPNQSQMQNINSEMRFSAAGELTDESAQTIGRLLGVQYLITGTIEPFAAHHRLIFNVAETANTKNRSQYTATVDIRNDIQLTLLISDLRNLLSGTQANRPSAPAAKNRLSGEASILGVGLRYERSLSDIFSLGANFFWQTLIDTVDLGILAAARLFPGGSIFFMELGLGYGYMEREYLYKFKSDDETINGNIRYKNSGFMISPAIGLSFSRKTRGFLTDIFISVPIILGEKSWIGFDGEPEGNVDAGFRLGISLDVSW